MYLTISILAQAQSTSMQYMTKRDHYLFEGKMEPWDSLIAILRPFDKRPSNIKRLQKNKAFGCSGDDDDADDDERRTAGAFGHTLDTHTQKS